MSKGGRPALDMLGQELRRGEEDYGPLDGDEYVAVFSNKDAQGRPKEGRKPIRDISFDVPDFLVAAEWEGGTLPHGTQQIRSVNVPGAEIAARVIVTYDQDLKGCFTHGYVLVPNGVNCYVANLTGATQNIGAGILYVSVWNIEDGASPEGSVEGSLLLETGDEILLETGDEILLGMSYAGHENVFDDIDPDDEVAMSRARMDAALRDAKERRTILDAVNLANGLEREVAGDTPGLILNYLRDMRDQAIQAMADLISKPGMDEKERIAAQLAVQPYAHLMQWLQTKVAVGRGAKMEVADLDRHLDGQVED